MQKKEKSLESHLSDTHTQVQLQFMPIDQVYMRYLAVLPFTLVSINSRLQKNTDDRNVPFIT